MTAQETRTPPGLSTTEVSDSRERNGSNAPKEKDFALVRMVFKSLFSVFNLAMAAVIAVLLLVGQSGTGKFIGIVAAVNTLIEVVQEVRARLIIKKIAKLAEKTSRVRRDGRESEVPVNDLVIGDIILLAPGDRVPVDGEVVEEKYAEFDESILTGESKYITKKMGEEVRAGSFLAAGNCEYRMTTLSKNSYIQRLVKQVGSLTGGESPLQSQINQVIKALTYMTLFFIALLVVEGLIQENQKEEIVVNSAILITSLVPQGLVLITTLSFAYGAMRMAKNQAVVQKLSAIESMANTKVVCLDKTGTLTKNALEVKETKFYD